MARGVGPYFPIPLFFGVYMFKEVICRSCGCRNGAVYVEIDDPIPNLHDEITELKRQLEIAKKALREINCSDEAIFDKWVTSYELRELARLALKQLESAGE